MTLHFTKMHGLGNDFIVIDGINQTFNLQACDIQALSRRDTGVGFDQCLLVEESHQKDIDFTYRIFNASGDEVGQCGNGARCLARFLRYRQLTDKSEITVATKTTQMTLIMNDDHSVTVNMGRPKLHPHDIPLKEKQQATLYQAPIEQSRPMAFHALNIGNPHAVIIVPDIRDINMAQEGKILSEHPVFPEQANVGFMQIVTPDTAMLRVYERGCGETQACGSGAVAAAIVGRLYHQMSARIHIKLPGGTLTIDWKEPEDDVFLTGPATFVYEGKLIRPDD